MDLFTRNNWSSKRTFNIPSTLNTAVQDTVGHAKFVSPLSHRLRDAIIGKTAVTRSVVQLFFIGSPSAIIGRIRPVVINAVKACSFGSATHIAHKYGEVVPFRNHVDSSSSPRGVPAIVRILASVSSRKPRGVFRRHLAAPRMSMSHIKLLVSIPFVTSIASGCMTSETRSQLATSEAQVATCWEKAVAYQHAALKNVPSIKSEVGALFYLSIIQQNQDKLFASCDDSFIALLNSHNQRYAQNMSLTKFLGGFAIGAYALDSLASTWAGSMGSSTTTQITGSRVVSGSGNQSKGSTISASGEGLGQANTFSRAGQDAQVVGGFQPRTNPVQTDSIDTNSPESASGENTTGAPTEGSDDVTAIPLE